MKAWDSLIERIAAAEGLVVDELVGPVKDAFDRVHREDRLDAIQAAVNLLPDESFPVLYGILYDPAGDPEVLDAIFSDALNRPEELKEPILRKLRQDRDHPLFFESARILDATGGPEDDGQAGVAGEP